MIKCICTTKANKDCKWCHGEEKISAETAEDLLFESVEHLNIDYIKYLLDKGVDINIRNSEGETPLIIALKHGQNRLSGGNIIELTKLLIKSGAEINVEDENGYTPLLYAVKGNSNGSDCTIVGPFEWRLEMEPHYWDTKLTLIKTLLQQGVKVSYGKHNPLKFAIQYADFEVFELLYNNGAKISKELLDISVIDGTGPMIEYILDKLPSEQINWLHLIESAIVIDGMRLSSIIPRLIKLMIEKGGDINQRGNDGLSLLDILIIGDYPKGVEILLNHNVNVNYILKYKGKEHTPLSLINPPPSYSSVDSSKLMEIFEDKQITNSDNIDEFEITLDMDTPPFVEEEELDELFGLKEKEDNKVNQDLILEDLF